MYGICFSKTTNTDADYLKKYTRKNFWSRILKRWGLYIAGWPARPLGLRKPWLAFGLCSAKVSFMLALATAARARTAAGCAAALLPQRAHCSALLLRFALLPGMGAKADDGLCSEKSLLYCIVWGMGGRGKWGLRVFRGGMSKSRV